MYNFNSVKTTTNLTAHTGTATWINNLQIVYARLLGQDIRDARLIHGEVSAGQDTAEAQ